MNKANVAGLKIDSITKQELLKKISQRMRAGERTFITTPYSEFLYHALRDPKILDTLNQADFSVPDGIGIFWAAKFLQIKFVFKNYWLKILEALWQMTYTLAAILIWPRFIYGRHPEGVHPTEGSQFIKRDSSDAFGMTPKGLLQEKISGSDLIWDLAKLAAENSWSIFLLGGFNDTPKIVADKLISKYPNLKISGYSSKNPDDRTLYDDLKKTSPDMIFVAYGPIRQEAWIAANMQNLPGKLFIGLGGTFDYIAGKHPTPPRFIRAGGLEWLYRLITQPHRVKRIFQATFGLSCKLVKYKIDHPTV